MRNLVTKRLNVEKTATGNGAKVAVVSFALHLRTPDGANFFFLRRLSNDERGLVANMFGLSPFTNPFVMFEEICPRFIAQNVLSMETQRKFIVL